METKTKQKVKIIIDKENNFTDNNAEVYNIFEDGDGYQFGIYKMGNRKIQVSSFHKENHHWFGWR